MFTSKIDKLVYVVGIYAVTSFTVKVATKTVKGVTKELEKAHTKAEPKPDRDIIDILLADLNDVEKAELDNKLVDLWKSFNNGDLTETTEY